MKILISVNRIDPGDKGNPFVSSLRDGLQHAGHEVFSGHNEFFYGAPDYDLVLLQWPEELWGYKDVAPDQIELLANRLCQFKKAGCVIGYTRHNLMPHYCKQNSYAKVYQIVEQSADIVFHMGLFSIQQFEASGINRKAENVLLPHHLTCEVRKVNSGMFAKRQLGIPLEAKVVLAFGRFRDNEERDLAIKGFSGVNMPLKRLLMPSLFVGKIFDRRIWLSLKRLMERMPYCRYGAFKRGGVSAEKMHLYFECADVVLIQRKHILNSGNLPMAFNYGRVVVGPNCGNVGEILRETGNPVFDPNDIASVSRAMEKGLELAEQGLGRRNRRYALENWNIGTCVNCLVAAVERFRKR